MGPVDHALMRALPWLYALPPGFLRWTLLILTGVLMVWAGAGIFSSALRGLAHGATNMNTLIALGTSVAFLYSAYATIWPASNHQVYFDAVLLILGFLLLGKVLEARAKRRALAALDSLSRLRPVTTRRIVDGVETLVPLDEIRPGDRVLILPGERFPVDATIIEGRTSVDESMLTGESTPLAREPGGRVLAGSLNYDGAVVCRANRSAKPRCWRRSRAWSKQAQSSRAPWNARRSCQCIFVPVVLALALITAAAWVLATHSIPSRWPTRSPCW
jgi:Cu+-exporting ATPase